MKKIIINLAVLCVLAACEAEKIPNASQDPVMGTVSFILRDKASEGISRATSAQGDAAINKAQVVVYNSSGLQVACANAVAGVATLKVPLGQSGFRVCAVANSATDLSSLGTLSALTSSISRLGENKGSSIEGLEMIGWKNNVTFSSGYNEPIDLARFASKVEIDRIVNSIPGSPVLKLKGIYLINVNTACSYEMGTGNAVWMQKQHYTSSETAICGYTADIFNADVVSGTPYSTPHYFYCYPNPVTTDSSAQTWSPRFTRLVVEASYSGQTYYYPMNIRGSSGDLRNNSSYIITKLTITGPGSDSPDKPVDKGNVSFSLNVLDWATGISQEVEI